MVMLGIANSRMKDFYDIKTIANTMELEGDILLAAITATFKRRKTIIVLEPLYVFSDDFKYDEGKQIQWHAFFNKNDLEYKIEFSVVIDALQFFLEPVYKSIFEQKVFQYKWVPNEYQWKSK